MKFGVHAAVDTIQIGPRPCSGRDRGCDVSTFGSAETPSIAIFDGYLFDRGGWRRQSSDAASSASNAGLARRGLPAVGRRPVRPARRRYLVASGTASSQQLLIGHDGLGRHPVFYATPPGEVWFSSNIWRSRPVACRNDPIACRWRSRCSDCGPRRGRPSSTRFIASDLAITSPPVVPPSVSAHKYWDPLPEDDEPWLPEQQVLEEFEPALQRAVERCMNLGARGIMLSGGVDSVTVAALAAPALARAR